MKKKLIILNIKRHHGEIDWILPLLYRFDNSYNILTIFDFEKTFLNFKKNKILYNIWKKKNNYTYIKNKSDNIIFKALFKILDYLKKLNIFLPKIEKFVLDKISNLERFLSKKKLSISSINFFFIAHHNRAYLPTYIKKRNPKCLIIRFPESPWIFPTRQQNKNLTISDEFRNNFADVYLHTATANKKFFLGKTNDKKIIFCKNFRYEKWWMQKFCKKNRKKSFDILVATRPPVDDYFSETSYEKVISSIVQAAKQIENSKITFKTHPHNKEYFLLKEILIKNNFKNWKIKNDHSFTLGYNSDVCITVITSTCLDFLSLKKPTFEFFFSQEDANKTSTKYPHYVYNYRTQKWVSIFEYLGFLKTYKFSKDIVKIFKMIKAKQNQNYWKKYYKT